MIRATTEAGPSLSEQLIFSADEAALSARAVYYYTTSSLRTLEGNWDMEGLGAMRTSPAEAVGEIDRISQFVEFHKGLTEKFSGVVDAPPRPIELSPGEIESLGFSLFRLGHSGLTHARAAMRSGLVAPYDAAGRARAEAYLEQTADSAYKLFKELEPIGRSKPDVGWMVWESKPLAA